jgi:hypothetical protein
MNLQLSLKESTCLVPQTQSLTEAICRLYALAHGEAEIETIAVAILHAQEACLREARLRGRLEAVSEKMLATD